MTIVQKAGRRRAAEVEDRKKNAHSKDRVFITPAPNYDANDYIEFKGESENILIYEPPFTKSKTEDQLREFIGEK